MGEKRRAGEPAGRRLTPGERAKNWASAAVTAWPIVIPLLGLLGYTNKDHIGNWVGLAETDGITDIAPEADFRAQVKKFSQDIVERLNSIEANSIAIKHQLAKKDQENYEALKLEVEALKQEQQKWHGD